MRLLLLAALIAFAAPATAGADAASSERPCFASYTWDAWSASTEGDAIYLQVRQDEIYRVELSARAGVRKGIGDFLINEVRGTGYICSAIDLDLAIANADGYHRPLIARSLRRLTPEEAAALSEEERPS